MEVLFHPEALVEFRQLSIRDRAAMLAAFEKLTELGSALGFPHSSHVRGARRLRELRPRSGRSAVRAFYRRIGDRFVIGGFGPESKVDPRGFRRAVRKAETRLDAVEAEERR